MLIQQQPPTVKQKQIIKQDTTKKLFDEIDQEASRLIEEQRKKNVQKHNEMEKRLGEYCKKIIDTKNQEINEIKRSIEDLFTQNKNQHISQNNRLSFISICTALGLSLNFIFFAYLWYHTHR